MRPTLFNIGSIGVPAFFFMIMLGVLTATYVATKLAKKEGLSEVIILDIAIIAVVGSMIGARLFHVFVEAPDYYWEKPIRILYFWQGGFVSLGAFITSILGSFIYMKIRKVSALRYFDILAVAVTFAKFFVRAGCFLTGCCYGKPTDLPWGVVFKDPNSTANYYMGLQHVHPTQIYSMINAVIMFFVLYFVYKRRRFVGQVGAVFLMYYGVSRFLIEFLRGDVDRGIWFGGLLSTGQIMMIVSFVTGIVYYVVAKKLSRDK